MQAKQRAADGEMNDLAKRRVAEVVCGKGVVRLGKLLRSGPRADPVGFGLCECIGGAEQPKDGNSKHVKNCLFVRHLLRAIPSGDVRRPYGRAERYAWN